MDPGNLAKRHISTDESWKEVLRDICEVARSSLHNLVSSGTPPLPRCYQQEFSQAANALKKQKVLDMVRSDEDCQTERFRSVILSARDRISDARSILSKFESEAKANIQELDKKIDSMCSHLALVPTNYKEEIEQSATAVKHTSHGFISNLSEVLEQIGQQQNLLESLAKKVHEDPLTGVLNRRAWEKDLIELANPHGDSSKGNGKFTIAICDLDHFKRVNDSYGHPVGDAVLKQFALLLNDHFASSGSVYRYGGEEFGIILPGFSVEETFQKLEVFRQRLKKAVFVAMAGQVKIRISASYGVAQWSKEEDIRDVVSRADKMLYAAKKAGRDCIRYLQ